MREKMNKKGFTLAELLIVVAIIAVLTAIAIPVFTSQLEKSREATDLANLRSIYAEITTGMLTNDMDQDGATMTVLNGLNATTAADDTSITITVTDVPVAQSIEEWQTTDPNIAGFSLPATTCPTGDTTTVDYIFTIDEDTTYLSGIIFY